MKEKSQLFNCVAKQFYYCLRSMLAWTENLGSSSSGQWSHFLIQYTRNNSVASGLFLFGTFAPGTSVVPHTLFVWYFEAAILGSQKYSGSQNNMKHITLFLLMALILCWIFEFSNQVYLIISFPISNFCSSFFPLSTWYPFHTNSYFLTGLNAVDWVEQTL